MIERELKLLCGESFEPERLLERLRAETTLRSKKDVAQRDVYIDTPQGDLRAAGLSARCRTIDGRRRIDVKPVPIEASLVMSRAELSTDVSSDSMIGAALHDLVRQRLGLSIAADASPIVELLTKRRRWMVHADAFSAELVIDEVSVSEPEEAGAHRFTELELELTEGESADFDAFAARLAELEGLTPSRQSKFERAVGLVGMPPYVYGREPPEFDAKTSTGRVARDYCLAQLNTARAHELGTRVGLDTEQLHKMRVAIRRMRSALRTFAGTFAPDEVEAVRGELKWIAACLGSVRDLDVHRLALPHWRERLGREPRRGWEALAAVLEQHWQDERVALVAAITSSRYRKACERAQAMLERPAPKSLKLAQRPIGKVAGDLLREPIKRFRRALERFERSRTADDAHALRIEAKALRYSTELLRPLMSSRVWKRARRLGRFQDALGDLQDAAQAGGLADSLFAEIVGREVEVAYAVVVGRITGWSAATTEHAALLVDHASTDLRAKDLLETLERGR